MPDNFYDVVIIGAGPAGISAAITLNRLTKLKILVADAGRPAKIRPGESIPPDTLSAIRFLKAAQGFYQDGHFVYPGHVSVWGRAEAGYNDGLLDPMGLPWRLNRYRFDNSLVQLAENSEHTTLAWGLKYLSWKEAGESGAISLTFRQQSGRKELTTQAAFVVDATGPLARFAQSAGSNRIVDDRLVALVCIQDIANEDMTAQTIIEADSDGWWYGAKLPDRKFVTMYVTEPATLRKLSLNHFSGYRHAIGGTALLSTYFNLAPSHTEVFYTAPVYSSYLEKAYGKNWIAVGDAASCYDPIAAQGIFKGLTNGIRAGKLIAGISRNPDTAGAALMTYDDTIRVDYRTYFTNRNYLYGTEQRWPDAPFWRNRNTGSRSC